MRLRRAFVALGGVALLGLAACQLILGVKDEQGAPLELEAGPVAAADASRCALLRPPAGGAVSTDTSGDTFVFALRTLAVTPNDASLGFDLDGLCTGAGAEVPCVRSPDDLDGGVDNELANVLGAYGYSPPPGVTDPPAKAINDELSQGKYSALLIVRSFNGTANDDHTVVSLIGSPGMERLCSESEDGAPPQTMFPSDAGAPYEDGGCEVWSLGPYVSIGEVIDPVPIAGRVVDGLLIAHFRTLAFHLGPLAFTFEDATLTARLSATGDGDASAGLSVDGGGTADGVITGRARAEELIGALRQTTFLPLAGGGQSRPLCQQSSFLEEQLRSAVCLNRDVTLGADPASQRCRGISLALGFNATHVRPGHKRLEVEAGPLCDASFDGTCGADE